MAHQQPTSSAAAALDTTLGSEDGDYTSAPDDGPQLDGDDEEDVKDPKELLARNQDTTPLDNQITRHLAQLQRKDKIRLAVALDAATKPPELRPKFPPNPKPQYEDVEDEVPAPDLIKRRMTVPAGVEVATYPLWDLVLSHDKDTSLTCAQSFVANQDSTYNNSNHRPEIVDGAGMGQAIQIRTFAKERRDAAVEQMKKTDVPEGLRHLTKSDDEAQEDRAAIAHARDTFNQFTAHLRPLLIDVTDKTGWTRGEDPVGICNQRTKQAMWAAVEAATGTDGQTKRTTRQTQRVNMGEKIPRPRAKAKAKATEGEQTLTKIRVVTKTAPKNEGPVELVQKIVFNALAFIPVHGCCVCRKWCSMQEGGILGLPCGRQECEKVTCLLCLVSFIQRADDVENGEELTCPAYRNLLFPLIAVIIAIAEGHPRLLLRLFTNLYCYECQMTGSDDDSLTTIFTAASAAGLNFDLVYHTINRNKRQYTQASSCLTWPAGLQHRVVRNEAISWWKKRREKMSEAKPDQLVPAIPPLADDALFYEVAALGAAAQSSCVLRSIQDIYLAIRPAFLVEYVPEAANVLAGLKMLPSVQKSPLDRTTRRRGGTKQKATDGPGRSNDANRERRQERTIRFESPLTTPADDPPHPGGMNEQFAQLLQRQERHRAELAREDRVAILKAQRQEARARTLTLPLFSGQQTQYEFWKRSTKTMLENDDMKDEGGELILTAGERIQKLKEALPSHLRNIQLCLSMDEHGYQALWEALDTRFDIGEAHSREALIRSLYDIKKITKADDPEALEEFIGILREQAAQWDSLERRERERETKKWEELMKESKVPEEARESLLKNLGPQDKTKNIAALTAIMTVVRSKLPAKILDYLLGRQEDGEFPAAYDIKALIRDLERYYARLRQVRAMLVDPNSGRQTQLNANEDGEHWTRGETAFIGARGGLRGGRQPQIQRRGGENGPFSGRGGAQQRQRPSEWGGPGPYAAAGRPPPQCFFCATPTATHRAQECTKFKEPKARRLRAEALNLCLICLSPRHATSHCRSQTGCRYCKSLRHNSALCKQPQANNEAGGSRLHDLDSPETRRPKTPAAPTTAAGETTLLTIDLPLPPHGSLTPEVAVLPRLDVRLRGPTGEERMVRALIDSGASHSALSFDVAQELGLPELAKEQTMLTTAAAVVPIEKLVTEVSIIAQDTIVHKVRLHARHPLIPPVPIHGLRLPREAETFLDRFHRIANRPTPDHTQERIDFLWAVDLEALLLSGAVVSSVPGTAGLLLVTETRFGTMVRGAAARKYGGKRRRDEEDDGREICSLQTEPLCPLVDLQTLGITDPPDQLTAEPPQAKAVMDSIKINSDGRLEFPIPWVGDNKPSPNLGQARSRLWSTLRRFTPDQRQEYLALFKTYEMNHMIERVGELSKLPPFVPGRDHLLPHFGVIKASSTRTRVRPVFDSACRTPNGSLNECLPAWPPLSLHLLPALQAFRAYPIATVCDIRQAFLQLAIGDEDAKLFQFLLPKDADGPETDDNLLVYQWKRVVFGAAVAPFLLSIAIKYIAKRIRERDIPGMEAFELAETLAAQLESTAYADNLLIGAQDVETARALVDALIKATETFGWHILDFAASRPGIVDHLPIERRLVEDTVPILGLRWTRSSDLLYIKPPSLSEEDRVGCPTFRRLSALVAKFWDPLGAMGPTPLPVKQALSRCWTKRCPWDSKVDEEEWSAWRQFLVDWEDVKELGLPRYLGCRPDAESHLVITTDASPAATGITAHLVTPQPDGSISSTSHHREEPTHTSRTTDPVGAPAGADSDAAWSPTSDVAQTRLHPSPRRRYHQLLVALERLLRRTGIPRHLQAHEGLRGQPSPRDPRSALRHDDLHPDVTQRRRPPHPHHAHGPVPRSLGPVHRRPGLPATATDAMAPLPDANAPGGIRPREDAERGHGGSGGTGAAPTTRRIRLRRRGGRRPGRRGRADGTRDGASAGRRRGQVGGHSLAQRRGPTRRRLLGGSQRGGDGRSGSPGGEADG